MERYCKDNTQWGRTMGRDKGLEGRPDRITSSNRFRGLVEWTLVNERACRSKANYVVRLGTAIVLRYLGLSRKVEKVILVGS